jgi:DNA-binding PadR family transcriptional regulator
VSHGNGVRVSGIPRHAARGNLITDLRKLEDAGYLNSETTGNGRASRTSIALTVEGRAALDTYTAALRGLLGGL